MGRMIETPFIAHSELTNEIYIVAGKEKYRVTEQAIKAVMAIKALEKEPRKGHWIDCDVSDDYSADGYDCSVCGVNSEYVTSYCPNCGAKMESEE